MVLAQTVESVTPHNVNVSNATFKGKSALHATPADNAATAGLLIVKDSDFHEGIIEADLAGAPASGTSAAARGFIGIAFRMTADAAKYECIYLRPTNGRAEDQLRRNHSVQYISQPDYPWERLRKESPAEYETYADLVPAEWIHVKIEVRGSKARLWLNGSPQPAFLVNDLKRGDSKGAVALWVGPGTDAHFANLRITPF